MTAAEKQALLAQKKLIEKGPKPRTAQAERACSRSRPAWPRRRTWRSTPWTKGGTCARDRLVVMVRDPYWLHAYWELSRRSIQRAEVAMGQHWHAARPVLRLHEVSRNGTTSAARQAVRDIEIHGGVNNWYIDVQNPPKSYQVEIGYLAPGNRFYCLGPQQRGEHAHARLGRHLRPQLGRGGQGVRSGLRHDRRLQRARGQRRPEGCLRGTHAPADGRLAAHAVRSGGGAHRSRTSASRSIPS